MRTYSSFEKKMIIELTKIDIFKSNVLDFIARTILNDRGIEINEKERTVFLWYKLDDTDTPNQFFELIALLKYLETNHLIFKHSNSISEFNGNFVTNNLTQEMINDKVEEYGKFPIPTNVFDIVSDFKKSFLIVGTELMDLVRNNFKTSEDIKHEKEICIAIKSLLLAFIALLFSFLSPFIFDTKIEQKQLDNLIKEIKENNKQIIIKQSENIINHNNLNAIEKKHSPAPAQILSRGN